MKPALYDNGLGGFLKEFFGSYLREQCAASPHTIKSYRDSLKLLVEFAQMQKGAAKPLTLPDLDAPLILNFLNNLEDHVNGRGNKTQTRNLRLAAIHAFFQYLFRQDIGHRGTINRILAVPFKKTIQGKMDYLNKHELKSIFDCVNAMAPEGFRDFALLTFLYNTGCRSQEVANARMAHLDFASHTVTILGKGGKERLLPLWPATVKSLHCYLERYRRRPRIAGEDRLFIGQRGTPLTRFGVRRIVVKYLTKARARCESLKGKRLSTHSLRHTTAVHLLESGVEPNVIKAWLGHSSLESTSRYLDADLNRKRQALESFGPPIYVTGSLEPKEPSSTQDILSWLKVL